MKEVGIFRYNEVKGTSNYINNTLAQRLRELVPKIDKPFIETILLPLIHQSAKVSLRVLDWCCVNYAKKHHVSFELEGKRSRNAFYIHREYKQVLRARRRRLFDPFQRKSRIFFTYDDTEHHTTVAQLAFLLWARDNKVYRYTLKHAHKIEMDMRHTLKENRKKNKRKRQVLTKERKNWLVVSSDRSVFYDNSDEEEDDV
tara:strand:+ start:1087 stop:1686 length:600 start_codon:yes stop_codon:yes gene_type:complete